MTMIRFYAAVVQLALLLAGFGLLKSCTMQMLGLAAAKSEVGIISYSKFTRELTRQR